MCGLLAPDEFEDGYRVECVSVAKKAAAVADQAHCLRAEFRWVLGSNLRVMADLLVGLVVPSVTVSTEPGQLQCARAAVVALRANLASIARFSNPNSVRRQQRDVDGPSCAH